MNKNDSNHDNHRDIGRKMQLFHFPDHAEGGVSFDQRGSSVRRQLIAFLRSKLDRRGFQEIETPALNRLDLFRESGHFSEFGLSDEMFHWEQRDRELALRPMNCANHVQSFKRRTRSYRELPLRLCEFGRVYRNEGSGALSGLLRLRSFTIDDGHIFLRPEQVQAELVEVLQAMQSTIETFGLELSFTIETFESAPDEVPAQRAEGKLREAARTLDIDLTEESGEAAFYGPKIAVSARDALDRDWALGTVQLDYVIPERLDVEYVDEDGQRDSVVMIHRAYLGSIERFIGILLEHLQGLPVWLHPEPVTILPIAKDHREYAETIQEHIGRASIQPADDNVGKRIGKAHERNVPYIVIVGDDEEDERTVAVKIGDEQQTVHQKAFTDHVARQQKQNALNPSFPG